jgi:hypothetical protein
MKLVTPRARGRAARGRPPPRPPPPTPQPFHLLPSGYLNHSAEPNAKLVPEHEGLRLMRVKLIAIQFIDVDDEVVVDYGPEWPREDNIDLY